MYSLIRQTEDADAPAGTRPEPRETIWSGRFRAFVIAIGVFALVTTMLTYGIVSMIINANPDGGDWIEENDNDTYYLDDQNMTSIEINER